ncbi:hypothetical protein ACFVX6_08390 [Streptomyces sp. NPDC058289]
MREVLGVKESSFMTRRVTEALGCENKPREQAPVVKQGDSQ